MSERPHLWMTTTDPRRYFLVPRGTSLPEGELEVRDLAFSSKRVVLASIEDYEVDRAAAQAHVDAGWSRLVGQARDAVREFLGQSPSEDPPDVSLPFVGLTPGEVALDAEKRRASGQGILESLSSMVGAPVDDDAVSRLEERLGALGENLRHDVSRAAADVGRAFDQGLDALRQAAGVAPETKASSDGPEPPDPPKPDDETTEASS